MKLDLYLYDRDGERISLEQWISLCGDIEYSTVCADTVGKYLISTVWTGISTDDPPLIFETMVFCEEKESDRYRYADRESAISGHEKVLNEVKLIHSATEGSENAASRGSKEGEGSDGQKIREEEGNAGFLGDGDEAG